MTQASGRCFSREGVIVRGPPHTSLFLLFFYPGCAFCSFKCTPGCLSSVRLCCLLLDLSNFRLEFDGLCTYCIWTFRQQGDPYLFLLGSPGASASPYGHCFFYLASIYLLRIPRVHAEALGPAPSCCPNISCQVVIFAIGPKIYLIIVGHHTFLIRNKYVVPRRGSPSLGVYAGTGNNIK